VFLSKAEIDALDLQIARLRAATGVRVVAAEIGKADLYEELPWKAFALGVSLAALALAADVFRRPQWQVPHAALLWAMVPLAAGALAASLAIFVPAFGRLFLHGARCEFEVGQYAQAMFLRRGLFDTPHRNAILLLVSRFERRVHILPDTGLHDSVAESEWHGVIERMRPALRAARTAEALQTGLAALQEMLVRTGHRGSPCTAIEPRDLLIEERGA
jgi:putative membrane protein